MRSDPTYVAANHFEFSQTRGCSLLLNPVAATLLQIFLTTDLRGLPPPS